MPFFLIALIGLLFPLLAFSDTTVLEVDPAGQRVAIKRNYETQGWKNGEAICLNHGTTRLGCGRALMATSDRLWVGMGDRARFVVKGSIVGLSRPERGVSSIASSESGYRKRDKGEHKFDVLLGGHMSLTYFYPHFSFDVKLNERFTVGLEIDYYRFDSAETHIDLLGGGINFAYYLDPNVFKGFGIQLGPSLYRLGLTYYGLQDSVTLPAVKTMAFWRGTAKAAMNLDFGVGLGFQYVFKHESPLIDYQFAGFLPFVNFFVGYQF